eukprot:15202850-Ditylum_brightwellii.AAC.1
MEKKSQEKTAKAAQYEEAIAMGIRKQTGRKGGQKGINFQIELECPCFIYIIRLDIAVYVVMRTHHAST